MDSRVYQSKVRITEALLRLMESDDFSALTVSEITAHAHVSRNTFYRHFTDKYSVIEFFAEWLLDSYLAEVRRQGNGFRKPAGTVFYILERAEEVYWPSEAALSSGYGFRCTEKEIPQGPARFQSSLAWDTGGR